MKKNILRLGCCLLLASSLFLSSCSWLVKQEPKGPVTDIPGLPPKTQTGADTFGCMINGQPWTLGKTACFSCPRLVLDLSNLNPGIFFGLSARDKDYSLGIGVPITGVGTFRQDVRFIFFPSNKLDCIFFGYDATYEKGEVSITRFDTQARIVSGTFEGALYKPGCDTVKLTNGRFDVKF